MRCSVVEMMVKGRRLSRERLEVAPCAVGELAVHNDRSMHTGRRDARALLLVDTRALLPVLHEPRLTRMSGPHFILAGRQQLQVGRFDPRSEFQWYDQEWLCVAWLGDTDPGHPARTLPPRR